MRTVLQLGLHTSAEWIYLTEEGFEKNMGDPTTELPPCFRGDPEPFFYYGCDINPLSVAEVAKLYHDKKNTRFICCGVSNEFGIAPLGEEYQNDFWYRVEKSDKLSALVVPMSVLVNNLKLETFDILGVDVDGYEYLIFNDMEKWDILPTYISIETHYYLHRVLDDGKEVGKGTVLIDNMIKTLESHGYEIYRQFCRIGSDPNRSPRPLEIQFILS